MVCDRLRRCIKDHLLKLFELILADINHGGYEDSGRNIVVFVCDVLIVARELVTAICRSQGVVAI